MYVLDLCTVSGEGSWIYGNKCLCSSRVGGIDLSPVVLSGVAGAALSLGCVIQGGGAPGVDPTPSCFR